MIGAMLVVLATAGQSPAGGAKVPGADEWIARLGAPRYADREAAGAELEKLGRRALPALVARRDHRDLEVRSRVNALIVKIEGSLLLEPTPVALDFDDRPLGEVVAEIAQRSDIPVALAPGSPAGRRMTLHSARPEPFWSAMDRLADAADLGYSITNPGHAGREQALMLSPAIPRTPGPASDHGPFRVNLLSLHYQRDLSFIGRPGAAAPTIPGMVANAPPSTTTTPDGRALVEQFTIRLQAAAEPRLSLRQVAPLKLAAAVDDLGQSLVPASAPQAMGMPGYSYAFPGASPGALQLMVPLRRPDSPGRVIRLLRGTIPVAVSTRRPEPLVVRLDGAAGKTFRNDDTTLVVNDVKPMNPAAGPSSPYVLDLSITTRPSRRAASEPQLDPNTMMPRVDLGPLQVELLDASGRPVNWYVVEVQPNGEEFRATLNATPASGPPATLRYHGVVRANADIPFEFRDVPMP